MTKLLTQNAKIKKSGGEEYEVYNFGIPAYKSKSGKFTCPLAGECVKGCYAQQGAYTWSNVSQAFEYRFELTLTDNFVSAMKKEIYHKLRVTNKKAKKLVIRIHDSGDFYSLDYLNKWLNIMRDFPQVTFYAYTKMVPLFKSEIVTSRKPNNFIVIYSEGGKKDDWIDVKNDRHSRVFSSYEELNQAGYVDAMSNDLNAIGNNKKIGLVYHGSKSKQWSTNNE